MKISCRRMFSIGKGKEGDKGPKKGVSLEKTGQPGSKEGKKRVSLKVCLRQFFLVAWGKCAACNLLISKAFALISS
jgi:hypothetical protein